MTDSTIHLTPALYAYYQSISLREPSVLVKLREQTQTMSMSQMQISPEQGQFMRFLTQLMQAKRTLDIGTFTGYSALSVALGLPKQGQVIACDSNAEWTKIAKRFWDISGVADKIELRLGSALETLQELLNSGEAESFDFAFIDADKLNYDAYYELSLRLLRTGGLMAIDNVLWEGKVADPDIQDANTQAIRQLNEKILRDLRVDVSMIPIGDGLTLVRKL